MPRLIPPRFNGSFQPGNRLFESPHLNHVRADIVVGVTEFRIEFNSPLALGDRIVQPSLEMIRPTQKRVRFRGRKKLQRRLVQLHRAVVVAFHLRLICILQNFPCARQGFPAHVAIFSTRPGTRQKYESVSRARAAPVLCAGVRVEFLLVNMENRMSCIAGRSFWSPAAFWIAETSSSLRMRMPSSNTHDQGEL